MDMTNIDGLTREQILAMKPGRELDALVAEKIFGANNPDVRWSPSTDISAAWEVVKRMRQINWWVVINGESDKWNALFYWDPNQESFEAEATDVPEAICKAALLALKGKE